MICSPMNRESFTDQPQTLFIVAECDVLADQSTGKYVVRGYEFSINECCKGIRILVEIQWEEVYWVFYVTYTSINLFVEYQKKLKDAGVHTNIQTLEGTVHGYVSKPGE